jgi:hypothetical protein
MTNDDQVTISSLVLNIREDLREFRTEFRTQMQRTEERLSMTISRPEFEGKIVPRIEHEARWRETESRLTALETAASGDRKTALQWGLLILPVIFTLISVVVAIVNISLRVH